MRIDVTAIRYANALVRTAKDEDIIDQIESQLGIVCAVLTTNRDLMKIILHPNVELTDKKTILHNILSPYDISSVLLNFVDLLLERTRIKILPAVYIKYQQLADELQHRISVEATSAVPLTEDEKKELVDKLTQITDRRIKLITKIDHQILGGLVLRIKDKVIDGSVRKRLELLQQQMTGD